MPLRGRRIRPCDFASRGRANSRRPRAPQRALAGSEREAGRLRGGDRGYVPAFAASARPRRSVGRYRRGSGRRSLAPGRELGAAGAAGRRALDSPRQPAPAQSPSSWGRPGGPGEAVYRWGRVGGLRGKWPAPDAVSSGLRWCHSEDGFPGEPGRACCRRVRPPLAAFWVPTAPALGSSLGVGGGCRLGHSGWFGGPSVSRLGEGRGNAQQRLLGDCGPRTAPSGGLGASAWAGGGSPSSSHTGLKCSEASSKFAAGPSTPGLSVRSAIEIPCRYGELQSSTRIRLGAMSQSRRLLSSAPGALFAPVGCSGVDEAWPPQ